MNVIDRAESLCGDTYRYEENAEDADGTLRNLVDRANILPDLVAECKLQQERAEKAEANYQYMVDNAASQKLDGYRELGARAAKAEAEVARWQAVAENERGKIIAYDQDAIEGHWSSLKEIEHIGRGKQSYRQQAAAALGQPRAWAMSKERIAALEEALNAMEWVDNHDSGFGLEDERAVLQGMLSEAKQ